VYRLIPSFLQRRQRLFTSPHWWLQQEEGHPLKPTQSKDWLRAEGRYLTQLLQGPLHWWGILDLAIANDGRLLAFRLTPHATDFLQALPAEEAFAAATTTAPELLTEQDLTVIAPLLEVLESDEILVAATPTAWPLLKVLEPFVEVAGISAGKLCYRLSPKGV